MTAFWMRFARRAPTDQKMGWTRPISAAAIVLIAAAMGGCSGPVVTPNWEFRSVSSGEVTTLDSLRGKTVFLNVWATWCPPCVAELPSIQRLSEQFAGDSNVVFVLVSVDEDLGALEEFIADKDLKLPIYTPLKPAPPALQTEYIPATFIIDPQGKIAKKHVAGYEWDQPSVVKMIQSLGKKEG